MTTKYETFINRIIGGIAYYPIEIEGELRGSRSWSYNVKVRPTDAGLVIGKGAMVIQAIQLVLCAIARRDHMLSIRINIDSQKTTEKYHHYKSAWDEKEIVALGVDLVEACGYPQIHSSVKYIGNEMTISCNPTPPGELGLAIHLILDRIGKSYGKFVGLEMNHDDSTLQWADDVRSDVRV
jgi:predicted RNA-binding protein YlqC (UPF0109 family)